MRNAVLRFASSMGTASDVSPRRLISSTAVSQPGVLINSSNGPPWPHNLETRRLQVSGDLDRRESFVLDDEHARPFARKTIVIMSSFCGKEHFEAIGWNASSKPLSLLRWRAGAVGRMKFQPFK
jgi:hypothetical protein